MLVLRKLELKKKAKHEAGYILTNIAKLGLVKKRANNPEKQNRMRKEIIKDMKCHLSSFKTISRWIICFSIYIYFYYRRIKGLDGSTGAIEEVNRQISNLREDVKTLMDNQIEFQNTMMKLMGNKLSKAGSFTGIDSRFHDIDEDVVISRTR